jgi:hypothetical protein
MSSFNSCPEPPPPIPCSGHGTLQSNGLCLCEPEWTDGGDLFDGRILNMNGIWYSIDCKISTIGIRVVYSLTLLIGIIRLVQLTLSFYKIHQRRQAKTFMAMASDMTYRVLLIELCIVTPSYLIFTLLKLINLDVIGSDIAITIFQAITTLAYLAASSDLELKEFSIFAAGGMRVARREKLIMTHRRYILGTMVIYILGASLPFIALGLDTNNVGPTCNGMYIILLVRQASMLLLNIINLLGKVQVRNAMIEALGESSGNDSPNHHKSTSSPAQHANSNNKAQEVISSLNKEVKRAIINNIVLFFLVAVFMLPWLWAQYTYYVAFAMSMSGLRHPGKHFVQINMKNSTATASMGNNGNSGGAVVVAAVGESNNNNTNTIYTTEQQQQLHHQRYLQRGFVSSTTAQV